MLELRTLSLGRTIHLESYLSVFQRRQMCYRAITTINQVLLGTGGSMRLFRVRKPSFVILLTVNTVILNETLRAIDGDGVLWAFGRTSIAQFLILAEAKTRSQHLAWWRVQYLVITRAERPRRWTVIQ